MPKKHLLAIALAGLSATPAVASTDNDELMQELRRLAQRVEQLENANKKLETALGQANQAKELAARVEDIENEVVAIRKQPSQLAVLDGISAGAALTMVAQKADGDAGQSQLTTRVDVEVELPMGQIGEATGKLFAHFRAGDGDGVHTGAFATPNATVFNLPSSVLMQAWYQLDIPVGGTSGDLGRVELTFGKIDPFGFFDRNAIADDESEAFLNLAFVHNPILDAGGDIAVGEHGASPGLRLAYVSDINGGDNLTASLGLFGAGEGANFSDSFDKPLVLGQIEYAGKVLGGLAGAYRLYGWSHGRAEDFAGARDRHSGYGLSMDQQLGPQTTVFTRLGKSTQGDIAFDTAVTIGAELRGHRWGRAEDRLGIAYGWLDTSPEYRRTTGFDEAENHFEIYYKWHLNEHVSLTPDIQWIKNPAGDGAADAVTVIGLRAKAAF
jgi:hypothetical protein